jgi:hypothetical protein
VAEVTVEHLLELDRGPEGSPGRGEHRQRLIAPQLDQLPASRLHALLDDLGEPGGQPGRRLVAAFLGELGVAADVGDQERPDRARPPGRVLSPASGIIAGPQVGPKPSHPSAPPGTVQPILDPPPELFKEPSRARGSTNRPPRG